MKGRITAKISGHLSPVPLLTNPIYWQYDYSVQLYPLPDILVLSESMTKHYSENYENDVEVIKPCLFLKPCDVTEESDEIFLDVEF
jgi:hypothetical protein